MQHLSQDFQSVSYRFGALCIDRLSATKRFNEKKNKNKYLR